MGAPLLSSSPPKGAVPRPPAAVRQQSAPVNLDDSEGDQRADADAKNKKVTDKAGAMKSAINRLFNRGNKEFDPHIVDLSELARGRPRLDPGIRGDVVLVFEDQPSTIIAYSLSSKDYHDQFKQFLDYNEEGGSDRARGGSTTTRPSISSEMGGGMGGVDEGRAGMDGESPRINRTKSLEGVNFPGKQGQGQGVDDNPAPTPMSAAEERKELERRMMLRGKTHIKHHFRDVDDKGQTLCKYVCTTYWATQFQAVRKVFLSNGEKRQASGGEGDEYRHLDDDASYVKSLATSFFWAANGGKSGASFAKTADGRFVVKCISRTELQMFLDCAPAYFEYLSKAFFHGLPTVLCKIVGVYQIGYHNRVTGKRSMEQVAVMQDIFYGRKIGKIFDLKGSSRGRYVNVHKGDDEGSVAGTPMGGRAGEQFFGGEHDGNGTDESGRDTGTSGASEIRKSEIDTVLLDENFLEFTNGRPLPLTDRAKAIFHMSILNDTLFLSIINIIDYSILVGIDEEKHELVVGIIDYMRQYDIIKQMERVGKSVGMIAGAQQPTIIQPSLYKNRFQGAMERYFTTVPTKWTSASFEVSG
mmetsp:Transcript_722/g.1253  ORF Transcript_722/g.1253 Transcript_722/m.1253 type:complete len:583 (+) Transcript_722:1-1749(+)